MDGKIGILYQEGEQVGGVFDWTITGQMASWAKGDWVETKAAKLVTALSYWLIKKPKSDIFEVKLYREIRNQLVLIDAGKVRPNLPDTDTLDRRLPATLILRWVDD